MIGGHLDSRVSDVMNNKDFAPGANDDGSGVGAVIESARILSQSKFPATIVFVAFSGEEQGLLGAKMLAEKAKNENWQLEALLNNDMIGNNLSSETNLINANQLRVFSEGLPQFDLDKKAQGIRNLGLENDGEARQLARYIKEIGERYVDNLEVKLIYRNDRFLRGGDHTSFVNQGFSAVRLTEFNENYDHQHQDIRKENGKQFGDLPEFMDFEYFKKNVGVNVSVLANLAKSPSKPENVKMDVKELTNFTTIHWEKPKNGEVAGYYVLMRETDSSTWQKKFFTKENSMKLPYSKDNYFFAESESQRQRQVCIGQQNTSKLGFKEHVRFRRNCSWCIGFPPYSLLGKDAIAGVERRRVDVGIRIDCHCVQKSGCSCSLSGLDLGCMASPYSWFLECIPDTGN
jgi:hypothetical protein